MIKKVSEIRTLPTSAASGLVAHKGWLYIVADDELHLSVLSQTDHNYHQHIPLFAGELPNDHKQRKKQKPDLEALTYIGNLAEYPHGALLAIGSGSRSNRMQAVVIPLQDNGLPQAPERTINLQPFYAQLPFSDINIEGAIIHDNNIYLLQRANKGSGENALIRCNLQELIKGSATPHITSVNLPSANGVQLGFTDACVLPNGNFVFSAVAEDTEDSYNDGACVAAAIGIMNTHGEMLEISILDKAYKIEGLALASADGCSIYAVTDADNPEVAAQMLMVEFV